MTSGHPFEPRRQPEHAAKAKDDENIPPTVALHQDATSENAQGGAELRSGINQRVGESALMFGKIGRDDFRVAWIRDGLSRAEQQPHYNQRGETMREPRGRRGRRPDQKPDRHHPAHAIAIHKPS